MSDKNSTTHTLIERQLNVYLRERSAVWLSISVQFFPLISVQYFPLFRST